MLCLRLRVAKPARAAGPTPLRIRRGVGNDFCVPTRVVDRAAYRLARATASRSGRPSARKTARLPMNASPAPVVSTRVHLERWDMDVPGRIRQQSAARAQA